MLEVESYSRYLWMAVLVGAVTVTATAALRPRLFWPLLIVVTLATGGLSLNGFTIIDEILVACLLIGSFMALAVSRTASGHRHEESQLGQVHRWVFTLLILYMMVESFRGVIDLESPRKLRWVLMYGMLYGILFFISRKPYPFAPRDRILLIIAGTSLAYSVVYMAQGLIAESFRDINRFATQGFEWGSTMNAVFLFVISIPAAMLLTRSRDRGHQVIGWLTIGIAVVIAFYYESRAAWLVILGFTLISVSTLGLRRFAGMSVVFGLILVAFLEFFSPEWYGFDHYRSAIIAPIETIWTEPTSDQSYYDAFRKVQVEIAFPVISSRWDTFLFGYGFHGVPEGRLGEFGAEKLALYDTYAQDLGEHIRYYDSTEGFTALVTETGLIGLLLISANVLLVGRAIIASRTGPIRNLLLLSLVMTFLYLFIANIMDDLLFYLMIMPSGILLHLAEPDLSQQSVAEEQGVQVG